MSIFNFKGGSGECPVISPETLAEQVRLFGFIPFFENVIEGYSIEELTPRECWLADENFGPWDWKVDVLRSGDIAYGKFLLGGKASFATAEWYRDIMNYKRSLPRHRADGQDRQIYEAICSSGSIMPSELRKMFKLKKSRIDACLTRLMNDTLVVIGDIQRVYRGSDLNYNGWQRSSVCRPEDLFGYDAVPDASASPVDAYAFHSAPDSSSGAFPSAPAPANIFERVLGATPVCAFSRTPEESYERLRSRILSFFPQAGDKQIGEILK